MKAVLHPYWNTLVFQHKLYRCSGWPRSTFCLSQTAPSYHTSSFHSNPEHCKEKTKISSLHSNILLTSNSCGLHKHSKSICMPRTTGLHTLSKSAVLRNICAEGSLKGLYGRNDLTLSRGWSRSARSDRDDDERADDGKLEHRYMMERFASENDMLSRFRNTYIMTLVSLASIQLELSQIPSAIGAVAIVTAELNLVVGTVVYLSNLVMFRRTGRLFGTSFSGRALFAVVHFILWSLLLTLLFPDGDRIDDELKRYVGEEK